ncbi:hypothetical protein [Nonomuraea solani]|nr:hypothetical protein [Nonomuraea solani]
MPVLLDVCAALNLEAAGEFDAIADVLGFRRSGSSGRRRGAAIWCG